MFDVSDIEDPQYLTSFTNGRTSRDHNLMVRGRFVFEANYTTGLRVYDACDIDNVVEVGYFDTHPENDSYNSFDGMWGVYTRFPSGTVICSDRDRGLFVFDTRAAEAVPPPLPECATAVCGNGTVDDGEVCDTAILSGEAGACPTSCENGDPCALGQVVSPGTCSASCAYTTITEPVDDDGCCPAGADANTDTDCISACGNGVCETGEDALGCSADCPCANNGDCDDGDSCTFDRCAASACGSESASFGDLAGSGGSCGPDGEVNIFDIFAMLDAFGGAFADGCQVSNIDLASNGGACESDGVIDLFDVFGVLDAFSGSADCCAP